jgi:hypothetical protein
LDVPVPGGFYGSGREVVVGHVTVDGVEHVAGCTEVGTYSVLGSCCEPVTRCSRTPTQYGAVHDHDIRLKGI